MSGLAALYLSTAGLGLAFSAPPGVVTAESVRRGLQGGFRPALLVQLGSLIGDAFWAVLAFSGVALLVEHRPVRLVLSLIGAVFLLRLGWRALGAALGTAAPAAALGGGSSAALQNAFIRGAALSLSNPFALAFWLGAGGGAAALAPGRAGHDPVFVVAFAGFMSGSIVWCVSLAALVAWGRSLLRPSLFRLIDGLCGLAFGYYGLQLGLKTMHAVLTVHSLA